MIDPLNFDCIFRPAKGADFEHLHQLISSCWMETYGRHVSANSIRRFIDEDGAGEHLRSFLDTMQVAEIDGQVVGVVNQVDELITALNVAKPFRRNRIGFSLLHNAHLRGGRYLDVASFNTSATHFYESSGWRQVSQFTDDIFGTPVSVILLSRP